MDELISQIEYSLTDPSKGTVDVMRREDGSYYILDKGVIYQDNHDADGIIRYLSHRLQNLLYKG